MDIDADSTQQKTPASEEMEEIFLARQPILDRQQSLVAYELLFRSFGSDQADITEHMRATVTVVHNAFSGMGIDAVLGSAKGHINVDSQFLLSDVVEALPPSQVVLEIAESAPVGTDLIPRIKDLKQRGYSFALDGYTGTVPAIEPILAEVAIVKVDLTKVDDAKLPDLVKNLQSRKVRLAAEKVETKDQFERANSLGFDLFQGYHFARPQTLSKKQQKGLPKVQLLRLMSLILGDADTMELESEFKRQPTLSYNLLRMINSAAFGLREPVTSLRRAIMLLGRRQLQIWMQLLLYTAQDNNATTNPLMLMAATRGKLMETLAKADPQSSKDDHDAAFMTGILSLIDALLEQPKDKILENLMLSEDIKQALLNHVGPLGYLLRIAEHLEEDNYLEIKEMIADVPGLSLENLMQMQLEAFFWANSIDKESKNK